MKKEPFIALSFFISLIFLSACGAGAGTTSDLEEIGENMAAGKSMICTVEPASEDAPMAVNMTYYIDGDNIRVESEFNGQTSVAIQKGGQSFVQPMMGDTDCKWLVTNGNSVNSAGGSTEESESADFDYKQYEEDPMYKMTCTETPVDSAKFATDGKTCTAEEMMQGVMDGMMPEGMDMGAINMGN